MYVLSKDYFLVSNIKGNRLFYFYSPAVTTVKEPKIDFSLKYSICCWQLKSILLNNYTYSKKVKKKVLASFRYMLLILIYTHIFDQNLPSVN